MQIIESYLPVFKKQEHSGLCIRCQSNLYADPPDADVYHYFSYHGCKVIHARHILDSRRTMGMYRMGRDV